MSEPSIRAWAGSALVVLVALGGPHASAAPAGPASRELSPRPAVRSDATISLAVSRADLVDVIRMITDVAGLNLIVDPSVRPEPVTLTLDEVPWDQALELVLRTHDLGLDRTGTVAVVAPVERLVAVEKRAAELARVRRESADLVTVVRPLSHARAKDVERLVRPHLSARGSLVADARTNSLIIRDVPEVVAELTGLVGDAAAPARRTSERRTPSRPRGARSVLVLEALRLEGTPAELGMEPDDLSPPLALHGSRARIRHGSMGRGEATVPAGPRGAIMLALGVGARRTVELGTDADGRSLELALGLERDGSATALTFRGRAALEGRAPGAAVSWFGPADRLHVIAVHPGGDVRASTLVLRPEHAGDGLRPHPGIPGGS